MKKGLICGTFLLMTFLAFFGLGVILILTLSEINSAAAASEPRSVTVGNSTFVPISVGFSAEASQKKAAMEAVNKFEKTHPELTVLCWQPNYLVNGVSVVTDGVFIYHKLK